MTEQGSSIDFRAVIISAVAEAIKPLEERMTALELQFKVANDYVEAVKSKGGMLGRFLQ